MHVHHSLTLRASALAWSLAALSVATSAQENKDNKSTGGNRAGLPDDLIEAKPGKVELGLDGKQLFELSKVLSPKNEVTQLTIVRNCLTELGVTVVDVPRTTPPTVEPAEPTK